MVQWIFTGLGLTLTILFHPLSLRPRAFVIAEWAQTKFGNESCVVAHVHVKAGMFIFQVIEMYDRINVWFLVYSCIGYGKLILST